MADKVINVAIIGAGEEMIPLMRTLTTLQNFKILGVADEKKDAAGLAVAGELGIKTYLDFTELTKHKDLDIVIEASGSASFVETMEKVLPKNVRVMDWASARLSLVLAEERERLLKIETSCKLTHRYSALLEEANKKLDDKLLELSLLNEASKSFSSAFDKRNIAGFIFSLLKKKIGFCVYALLLRENGSYTLVLISTGEIPPELKEEIHLRMIDRYSKYAKETIDLQNTSLIEKVVEGPAKAKEEIEPTIKSLYSCPLVILEKPLGLMGMVFCKDYTLTSDEERFFDILTGQVALFIENDRIKQAITNERNRLESILKSMTAAVLVVDEYRSIVLTNPVAGIFLGVRNEEIIGKSIDSAIPQEDIRLLFNAFMLQQSEYQIRELKLTNPKDGIVRIIKANIAKMRDYLGNIVGAVLVFHDITKEKEVDRLKTEFISITSHELRTPLATIKNTITLLLNSATGAINDNQRKFLDMAKRNIDRLAALINNLLDLSKIESGKMELTKSEVDINAIAEEVTAAFVSLAKDKKVELKVELDKSLNRISADKDRIFQVVNNLVSNALKFTQPEGVVTVRTSVYGSDKNYVQISIRDTGIGIDKKDFDKLFQRFQQLDSILTRKVTGSGLGLAISKQIIELHGGKIWVDSEPEKGSVFSFILPVIHLEEKMGKKILVIDDEQDLCETVKAQLEANNFKVSTAQNGEDGMDKAKNYKPDLIILDLMMPMMDGFEVCRRLKKNSGTALIPIIVLTALEQEDAAKKALSMGAEGYMVKPFEEEALLFTIREFLK